MRLRRGVCQDFARLEIACLRSLGLPARSRFIGNCRSETLSRFRIDHAREDEMWQVRAATDREERDNAS